MVSGDEHHVVLYFYIGLTMVFQAVSKVFATVVNQSVNPLLTACLLAANANHGWRNKRSCSV